MTVKELIRQLKQCDKESLVHVVTPRATEMKDCAVEWVHTSDGIVWIQWAADKCGSGESIDHVECNKCGRIYAITDSDISINGNCPEDDCPSEGRFPTLNPHILDGCFYCRGNKLETDQ